jgi:REP element-mobilizing transposase RayT
MRGELDETRPHSITEVASRVMLEPISPGLYNLTYACLLVPRFSSHYLTGDISDRLTGWLPQICIAFGWRLEFLAVRPEYMQWMVNVPPATSPGYLMRIMRQQTSEKIFAEFVRLKKENPSGDFWAPGYLIMGGTQPHPPQLVKDYIKQTRTRQGYAEPRK